MVYNTVLTHLVWPLESSAVKLIAADYFMIDFVYRPNSNPFIF